MQKKIRNTIVSVLMGSAATISFSAHAQVGVTTDHRPNEHTLACLASPSKDCAISAALQTVINEDLSLERSKVLVGVSRGLMAQGDTDRARQTLNLAVEEARESRLNLILQERLRTIAPLMVELGDVATALALADEIQIRPLKDQTLLAIADYAVRQRDMSAVRTSLSQVSNNERAFWALLNAHVETKGFELTALEAAALEERIRAMPRADRKYRGLVSLALLKEELGDQAAAELLYEDAEMTFAAITSLALRAEAAVVRLDMMKRIGKDRDTLQSAYDFAMQQGGALRSGLAARNNALQIGALESHDW